MHLQLDELINQLQQDAAQSATPFGAASIAMAQQLGSAALPWLLSEVTRRQSTSFLALEALRAVDKKVYAAIPREERADIYVDELRTNRFFNTWGRAGGHLTETANALIDLGEAALSRLLPLLSDQRPALLQGSRDATMSQAYGNRVCDYAWVFLMQIKKQPYAYSPDPGERNEAIAFLQGQGSE